MTSGVIEDSSCQITVDTGSDISLVRPDVLSCELETPVTPFCLRMVMGTAAPLQSKVDLKLQLGNLTTHHTFYFADIADECILGLDYLKLAGAVLDLRKSLKTIYGERIPLVGAKKDDEPVCHRVVAATTTTLPSNSEAVIPVELAE